MNFTTRISETALQIPLKTALQDGDDVLSYSALDTRMKILAKALLQQGIKAGMGVAVIGKNSIEFVLHTLAVLHTGAVLIPLDESLRTVEINEILEKTNIQFILTSGNALNEAPFSCLDLVDTGESLRLYCHHHIQEPFCAQLPDAAFMRFTSGTTGRSKGVILTHQDIDDRTRTANMALSLGPADTVLWVLSMAYHFVASILLYLRYGCTIVIHHEFNASSILDAIHRHPVTFLYFSPIHIRMLLSETSGRNLSTVTNVISTSTGLDQELGIQFFTRYQCPVIQVYGIIELGLPVINRSQAISHPDAIGKASPGFDVDILDEEGNLLEDPNAVGQLAIRGPGMCSAYLHPFTPRNALLQHGYFLTGDLATKQADGLVTIKGRLKSMINVAGNKVFPEEVESVIQAYAGITTCRVYGQTHPILGETVVADFVSDVLWTSSEKEDLIRYCRKRLSRFKIPTHLYQVEEIKLTGSGKIRRNNEDN